VLPRGLEVLALLIVLAQRGLLLLGENRVKVLRLIGNGLDLPGALGDPAEGALQMTVRSGSVASIPASGAAYVHCKSA
jgi:hypothetical protein